MFSVAIRLNVFGLTIVAVPSQLLPTTRMSWVVVRLGFLVAAPAVVGSAASAATASAASSVRGFTRRIVFAGQTPMRGFPGRSFARIADRTADPHARRRRAAGGRAVGRGPRGGRARWRRCREHPATAGLGRAAPPGGRGGADRALLGAAVAERAGAGGRAGRARRPGRPPRPGAGLGAGAS